MPLASGSEAETVIPLGRMTEKIPRLDFSDRGVTAPSEQTLLQVHNQPKSEFRWKWGLGLSSLLIHFIYLVDQGWRVSHCIVLLLF